MTTEAKTATNEIIITREFDAPRDLVWRVWTEPKHIEKWWGPRGFDTKVTEMNLEVGGHWRYVGRRGISGPRINFRASATRKDRYNRRV